MKQYESFVFSQWNVKGLRSSAFGLKITEFIDELKNSDIIILMKTWDRGDSLPGCPPGYGELTQERQFKKSPWIGTRKDLRGKTYLI